MSLENELEQIDDTAATVQGKDRHVEREFEVGKDEAWSSQIFEKDSNYFANRKRTYDEYQHESLETLRQGRRQVEGYYGTNLESINRNQSYVNKVLSDAQQHDNMRQNVANQALQNAVETANMVGKQSVRHCDFSIDRQWNIDENATLTAKNGVQADAIITAMVKAVTDAIEKKK